MRTNAILGALVSVLVSAAAASAQTSPAEQTPPAAQTPPPVAANPDSRLDPLQPDFDLVGLPTTLRVPLHKSAFRVTHRFTRSLGRGDFGDLVSDFFGFDSGAQIGLEFRYGLLPGTQVGIHRTSDRTIQIFGQHNFMQQTADGHPFGLDVIATLEGEQNLQEEHGSTLGVLVSRKVGRVAAFYVEPLYVVNTNRFETGDNDTMMIGLGGRIRLRPAMYIVGEITPRVGGYKPGVDQASLAIEMRSGGHTFQINFSNGIGTTLRQIARGGSTNDSWYIGFNISRKFF